MNKRKLKKYIEQTNTWTLEGYKLPSRVWYWGGKEINLKKDHQQRLQFSSNHEQDFITDLGKSAIYIKEFPIPIHSKEIWRKYWPGEDHHFFSLDFFFPFTNPGLVVEIDGSQHQERRDYDKARDDYLRDYYGLETLRVDEYGWYWPQRSKEFMAQLQWVLRSTSSPLRFEFPTLEDFIIENWTEKYRDEIWAIELIEKEFPKDNLIQIKKRDFYRLTRGKIYTDKNNISQFNKLMADLEVNKKIIIP